MGEAGAEATGPTDGRGVVKPGAPAPQRRRNGSEVREGGAHLVVGAVWLDFTAELENHHPLVMRDAALLQRAVRLEEGDEALHVSGVGLRVQQLEHDDCASNLRGR